MDEHRKLLVFVFQHGIEIRLPGILIEDWSETVPQTPHIEKHFTASESVRDIVIGMSDGLTVPLALAAGLSHR